YLERAPLIVEAYYPVSAVLTAEFKVDAAGNAVTFVNCGEVRQAPILSGLLMPAAVAPYPLGAFIPSATQPARLCCDLGDDGLVNVDGMVTAGGAVMINEINGRIGGCSHIHHILQAVAGRRYGDTLVTLSHSRNAALSIDQAFAIIEEHKLTFDATAGPGITPTGQQIAS